MQDHSYSAIITSPLGKMGLVTAENKLCRLDRLPAKTKTIAPQDAFNKKIVLQLEKYFKHPKTKFNLDFDLHGTEFQKKVWGALQEIPSGELATYGMLAKKLKTSPRAVGQACRTNPIPVIIPCHRVVAANHLGGYAGATDGELMDIKIWLLEHEGMGCSCC